MKERLLGLQEKLGQTLENLRPDRLVERFRNASRIDKIRAGVFIGGTALSVILVAIGINDLRNGYKNAGMTWLATGAETEGLTFYFTNPLGWKFIRLLGGNLWNGVGLSK